MNTLAKKNLLCVFLFTGLFMYSQTNESYFELPEDRQKYVLSFQLINNLIIVPVKVNGDELNFILDSGVSHNIIFNLTADDSVLLYDLKKVELRGLGVEGPVEAYYSRGNVFNVGKLVGINQDMFILSNELYDLSTKLGINVHGVIGYELLKNFTIKINYRKKLLTFYVPEHINSLKKFKRYEKFPLTFNNKKPYVDAQVVMGNEQAKIPVHLLVDSGGSDALWLFTNKKRGISLPEKNQYQYMGMGLSGKIYGNKSKVNDLNLNSFSFRSPNVSFPDSLSIGYARSYLRRDGSLGGNILKRFHVIFDYPNQQILLRKNRNFKDPFKYNISGMEVVYNGKIVVQVINNLGARIAYASTKETIKIESLLDYEFKPLYKIYQVSPGTPAYKAGVQKGDILVKIGRKLTTDLTLEEINTYLQNPNSKLKITLRRGEREINTSMELIDIF